MTRFTGDDFGLKEEMECIRDRKIKMSECDSEEEVEIRQGKETKGSLKEK